MADKFQKTKKKNYKNGKKAKKVKVKITKDDYYNKNTEFRVWLSKKYNMFLDEVKSEVLKKKFFKEFVKKWNKGKLPKVFYTGAVDSSGNVPATRFSWSFDTLDKHLNEHLSSYYAKFFLILLVTLYLKELIYILSLSI